MNKKLVKEAIEEAKEDIGQALIDLTSAFGKVNTIVQMENGIFQDATRANVKRDCGRFFAHSFCGCLFAKLGEPTQWPNLGG